MNADVELNRNRAGLGTWALTCFGALLGLHLAGCTEPEDKIPPAKAEPVTAYGMTLDETATPKQVAYVLLRSLAEDVKAAQDHPPRREDQQAANLITWSVAAHNEIERRLLEGFRAAAKDPSRYKSLGKDRNKEIYRVVNLWAPIVAYYVNSFDQDAETAMSRMQVRPAPNSREVHVLYEVAPDPSRPDADRRRTLDIDLVKEKGAGEREYWRVARVGYLGSGIRPVTRPAAQPTTRAATQPG